MVLNGYCDIQEKTVTISVSTIPISSLEDRGNNKCVVGRIYCDYASHGGDCDGRNCSILKQYNLSR